MTREGWTRAYREAPHVLDAFAAAEDPDGELMRSVAARAGVAGRRVLEVGCGSGRHSERLAARAGTYLATEPAPALVRLARRRLAPTPIRLALARGETLPVTDGWAEIALATWVLANLPPRRRAAILTELVRAVRPGGAIWAVESAAGGELGQLRGRDQRLPDEIAPLLDAGFELVELVEAVLRFPDPATATRVVGFLCGADARRRLAAEPRAEIGHRIAILCRRC